MNKIELREYLYDLPDERIAKFPLKERDASKLLVYKKGNISETVFNKIGNYLTSGTLLCYNDTKVIFARLEFHKESGARIEILCLEPEEPFDYQLIFQTQNTCDWQCMIGNKKKWKEGVLTLHFYHEGDQYFLKAELIKDTGHTNPVVRFTWNGSFSFASILTICGIIPLPPYLNRKAKEDDKERYQTVYSQKEGSVAAPTAGLHFTHELLNSLKKNRVERYPLTLHVGAGTFQPVKTENVLKHTMHTEHIIVKKELVQMLLKHSYSVTAVGTTSVRTLETIFWFGAALEKGEIVNHADQFIYKRITPVSRIKALQNLLNYFGTSGISEFKATTQLMIVPGYHFHLCDALITNFHQPGSTLLLLIAAFTGGDNWKKIYNYALENSFRFLSYGDSSLLIP